MKNIYLIGECMIELMHSSSNMMKQSFAGDVFNTAVYLKRLQPEINVNLITAVGQDKFSNEMLDFFAAENLGTDMVFRSEDKVVGLYSIQLDDQGERSFIFWRNDSAARGIMNFIDNAVLDKFESGDIFFFSGVSLGVVKPEDREKFWLFVENLKAKGVKLAFDLNYRPKLWANKEEAQTQFTKAFACADILLPGVDDFAAIFDLDNVDSIIDYFKDHNYQELVIKNGEKNVYCLSEHGQEIVDVIPVTKVVDTTSAGDSFNGGYLSGRLTGKSIVESVALANKVAGFVIQHPGAIVDKTAFAAEFG